MSLVSELLVLQKVHGHIALLAIALCFHPWFALRRARRPSPAVRLSGYLATGGIVLTSLLGWWIYPPYREEIKAELYLANPFWGDLFEVKEHWGWYSLVLAVAAGVLMWLARDRAQAEGLRQPIRWLYALSGLLALAVGVFGILIASIRGFAYPI